jgi:hypothetical protein
MSSCSTGVAEIFPHSSDFPSSRLNNHTKLAATRFASYKASPRCTLRLEITPDQMQQATHPRLHVRDARDAHIVFEAVRQGFLRPAIRRLNEMERSMFVQSGAIFVWEQGEDDSGLKRWTGQCYCLAYAPLPSLHADYIA